jgi:uncharacterized protein (DUF2141 family)
MAQKGSKNDARNRNSGAAARQHKNRDVTPVKYDGRSIKQGQYMAGRYKDAAGDGSLIRDEFGSPIPYHKFDEAIQG